MGHARCRSDAGAFYAHFSSKSELYARSMTYAAIHGRLMAYRKRMNRMIRQHAPQGV